MPTVIGGIIVVASVAAGLSSAALAGYLARHRDSPGATWFMGSLLAQAVWAIAYGVGLLLVDPFWRASAEALAWIGMNWVGPLFLGFALGYTGRSQYLRTKWVLVLFLSPVMTTVLGVTHFTHSLLWDGFRIAPVFDLTTVLYSIQPLAYATVITSLLMATLGVLLLVETVVSYGPIYRRESIAVVVSALPASLPLLLWLSQLGPFPQLNLTPALLLSHVAFDAYAFVNSRMFETNPVTQRAAEQTALEGLDDPLLVVDPDDRVVNVNDSAASLFGTPRTELPVGITDLVGVSLSELRETGELNPEGSDSVYAVSYTPLSDSHDTAVGGVVVLYDITTERQQRQQLSVLNRVLRHNLRNEMTVIQGFASSVEQNSTDEQTEEAVVAIKEASERLLSIAQNIRESERIQTDSVRQHPVETSTLIADLQADINAEHPDAEFTTEVSTDVNPLADPKLLMLALRNLVENAIVHADTQPVVTLRVTAPDADSVEFAVLDTNDPIPQIEVASLTAATEEPLQHGIGLGLWTVKRCVDAVGGELAFEDTDGNVVRITLPAASQPDEETDAAVDTHAESSQ